LALVCLGDDMIALNLCFALSVAGFEMMRLFNPLKFFSDVALNFVCFIFRLCFGMDVCHGDFQQEELMTSNEILTYIFLDLEFPVQGISLISSFLEV
jgi:hypothetical protein